MLKKLIKAIYKFLYWDNIRIIKTSEIISLWKSLILFWEEFVIWSEYDCKWKYVDKEEEWIYIFIWWKEDNKGNDCDIWCFVKKEDSSKIYSFYIEGWNFTQIKSPIEKAIDLSKELIEKWKELKDKVSQINELTKEEREKFIEALKWYWEIFQNKV